MGLAPSPGTFAQRAIRGANALVDLLGTLDRTVRKWRGRWVKPHSLADAPRSGAPRRFSPIRVRAQVTAIACSLPKQCQVPLSRWSRAELARRVAQDPTLPHISASTVGRWRNRRTPSSLALSCLAAHP